MEQQFLHIIKGSILSISHYSFTKSIGTEEQKAMPSIFPALTDSKNSNKVLTAFQLKN